MARPTPKMPSADLGQCARAVDRVSRKLKYRCMRCRYEWWNMKPLSSVSLAILVYNWRSVRPVTMFCPKCDKVKP